MLCARLGEEYVTSIEYDEEVASRARTALGRRGCTPRSSAATASSAAAEVLYDRVIATCGVCTVPAAWIEQTRPGGLILTTIGGWLGSSDSARHRPQRRHGNRAAHLSGQVSFMLARPHTPPALGVLDLSEGKEREAIIGTDALNDWTSRFSSCSSQLPTHST